MRNKVDVTDIEAFTVIGNTLSFRTAAGVLNISPSALTRRIQKLEAQLDIRLIDRTTRDVKLTLPGKEFLSRSQDILDSVDELVTAMRGEDARRTTMVTIGVIPSIAHQILPEVIRLFGKRHSNTRIKVKDLTTNEIFDAVQRGEADFGITSFLPHDPNLEFVPLMRRTFVVVTPRNHALAKRRTVRWAELAQHRVISTWKGAGVRIAMDLDLAKANNWLSSFYEVQQIYTALRFVEDGLGIAPIPSFFLGKREKASLSIIPLIDPVVAISLGTVRSPSRSLRRQALEFWKLIHTTFGDDQNLARTHRPSRD